MVAKRLIRLIRRRLRPTVALAMVPLAILNAWPVLAGCICADGHYEPVCNAGLCRADAGDCGCSYCAERASNRGISNCCNAKTHCCHRRSETSPQNNDGGKQVSGNGCCTPIVHVAAPAVITMPHTIDLHQTPVLMLVAVTVPLSTFTASFTNRVEVENDLPPNDLVVALQRLVI